MMQGMFSYKKIGIAVKKSEILTEMGIFMYRPRSGTDNILDKRYSKRCVQTEKISSGLDVLHVKNAPRQIVKLTLIYQNLIAVIGNLRRVAAPWRHPSHNPEC
jgi:hypothetical protein